MMNPTRHSFYAALAAGLATLAVGILFTAKPLILNTICLFAGIALCAAGVLFLIVYFVKNREFPRFVGYASVCAVAGILLMIIPGLLGFLIPIFFGFWLLLNSASGAFRSISLRREMPFWWIGLILGILGCAIGVYVITRPTTAMESTVRIIGIAMIVSAVIQLISSLMGRHYYAESSTGEVVDTTIGKD